MPIVAGVSYALFRWVCAPPDVARESEPISEQERRVYRWWELGSAVPYLLLVPLFGYLWYLGLTRAASLFDHHAPGTRFLVQPSRISWFIPAFFLGAITAVIPLEGLYRGLLRDRYRRYELYSMGRGGAVARRIFVGLAVALSAGAAVWFLAEVTSFTRFTDAGVEIQRPLSLSSRFYEYARVQAIEHRIPSLVRNGNTVRYPHYVILFDDGTSWSSREGLRDPVPDLDEQIASLVSRRSQQPIVEKP
jgi:hypothetical protein